MTGPRSQTSDTGEEEESSPAKGPQRELPVGGRQRARGVKITSEPPG